VQGLTLELTKLDHLEEHDVQVLAVSETWVRDEGEEADIKSYLRAKGWLWEGQRRAGQRQEGEWRGRNNGQARERQEEQHAYAYIYESGEKWERTRNNNVVRIGAAYLAPETTTGGGTEQPRGPTQTRCSLVVSKSSVIAATRG